MTDCVSTSSSMVAIAGSTPETFPMEHPIDMSLSPEKEVEEKPVLWGWLYPVTDDGFPLCHLKNGQDEYTFGRGTDVDFTFCSTSISEKNKYFASISKLQFKIIKEKTEDGFATFVVDVSSNGTFVDGIRIGKNNKLLLPSNSKISLAHKDNQIYVFFNTHSDEKLKLPKEMLQRFDVSDCLGRGAMGEVRLAFERSTGDKYAVKIIKKAKLTALGHHSMDLTKAIERETEILKALSHPCIIKIDNVYESDDTTFIILELAAGRELFDRIVNGPTGRFDEPLAKFYFYQMIHAIKYLHDQQVAHRDLKPENILMWNDDVETLIKVTDFGLSKFVDAPSMLKTYCGTPNYLAPEILKTQGAGVYTEKVDLWALGVILFVSLSGYPPFSKDYDDMSLDDQVLQGRIKFNKSRWDNVSEEAMDLVKKLLTVDAKKRISATEAFAHPWLQDDLMKAKAHKLMYPQSDGMVPPTKTTPSSPGKKRGRLPTEENDVTTTTTITYSDDGTPAKKRC